MFAELRQQKQLLRQMMKKARDQAKAKNPDIGLQLRDYFLQQMRLPPHAVIAAFYPFGSEIDVLPLTEALRGQGHKIALPVVTDRRQALQFRLYNKDDALVPTDYGTSEPASTAPVLVPDVLLVPLLAFDRDLYRLGYGAGFYDRTLLALRQSKIITAIGVAYAAQETASVPHDELDARLDAVVTEKKVFKR